VIFNWKFENQLIWLQVMSRLNMLEFKFYTEELTILVALGNWLNQLETLMSRAGLEQQSLSE